MQLSIRGNIRTTNAIREHVERRLSFALDRLAHRVSDVAIRISNEEPHTGPAARACQMRIHLHSGDPLLVEARDRDLYTAIDQAASRAREVVRRAVKRRIGRRRH